jgi:hypothetical protein
MIDIGLIEIEAVDLGIALLLTLGATEIIKRVFVAITHDQRVEQLAPLYSIVAASLVVALVIDVDAAGMQEYGLAVLLISGTAIGAFSGIKNVSQGVKRFAGG